MDHRDWLAWVVDIAQIVGAIGSVVAIAYAAVALRSAKLQEAGAIDRFVAERRRQYELENLTALARLDPARFLETMGYLGGVYGEFGNLARLLGPTILPYTCAALRFGSNDEAVATFDASLEDQPRRAGAFGNLSSPGPG